MMIDVHMKDGRTVFRLRKRGLLVDLIKRKVVEVEEQQSLSCWVRWHTEGEFEPIRLTTINSNSIAFTREVSGEERAEFEASR